MSVLNFDSLSYIAELEKAGFSRAQAEALFTVNISAFQTLLDAREIATKSDVMRLEQRIEKNKNDLLLSLEKVDSKIEKNKNDLLLSLEKVDSKFEISIRDVQTKLEISIRDVQASLIKWVIGLLIAQSALFFTALAYFK